MVNFLLFPYVTLKNEDNAMYENRLRCVICFIITGMKAFSSCSFIMLLFWSNLVDVRLMSNFCWEVLHKEKNSLDTIVTRSCQQQSAGLKKYHKHFGFLTFQEI